MGLKEDIEILRKLKGKKVLKKLDEILDTYSDEIFASIMKEERKRLEKIMIGKVKFSEEHERKMEELFKSLEKRDK